MAAPYDQVSRAGLERIARSVLGANFRLWKRSVLGHPLWQLGYEGPGPDGHTKRVLCEAPDLATLAEQFLAPVREYAAGRRKTP